MFILSDTVQVYLSQIIIISFLIYPLHLHSLYHFSSFQDYSLLVLIIKFFKEVNLISGI